MIEEVTIQKDLRSGDDWGSKNTEGEVKIKSGDDWGSINIEGEVKI